MLRQLLHRFALWLAAKTDPTNEYVNQLIPIVEQILSETPKLKCQFCGGPKYFGTPVEVCQQCGKWDAMKVFVNREVVPA